MLLLLIEVLIFIFLLITYSLTWTHHCGAFQPRYSQAPSAIKNWRYQFVSILYIKKFMFNLVLITYFGSEDTFTNSKTAFIKNVLCGLLMSISVETQTSYTADLQRISEVSFRMQSSEWRKYIERLRAVGVHWRKKKKAPLTIGGKLGYATNWGWEKSTKFLIDYNRFCPKIIYFNRLKLISTFSVELW